MGNPIPGISYCRVFGSLPIYRFCKTDTNNEYSFKNAKRSSGRTGQILFISGPKTKLTTKTLGTNMSDSSNKSTVVHSQQIYFNGHWLTKRLI